MNRTIDVFVPFEQEEKNETGRAKTVYSLTLFGKSFDLNKCDYEEFYRTAKTSELRLSKNIILPVRLTRTTFSQTETAKTTLTKEQAYEKALTLLDEAEARGMKNIEIESRRLEIKYTSEGIYAAYRYSVVTDFGKDAEIRNNETAEERE